MTAASGQAPAPSQTVFSIVSRSPSAFSISSSLTSKTSSTYFLQTSSVFSPIFFTAIPSASVEPCGTYSSSFMARYRDGNLSD